MSTRFPAKAVLVFAKSARPGHVKTRLRTELTAREAADVHLACVRDTVRMIGSVGGARKWLLVAGGRKAAKELAESVALNPRWRLALQTGRDLGGRLDFALHMAFAGGARKVVVVGTDTPWMGADRIYCAFQLLDRADVVLGPTQDGGYYLVGARRVVPEMFRGIAWGSRRVLQQTLRALRKSGASVRLLRRDFDLDRPADLRRAWRLLRKKRVRASALKRWMYLWDLTRGSSRRRPRVRRRKKRPPGRA